VGTNNVSEGGDVFSHVENLVGSKGSVYSGLRLGKMRGCRARMGR
jgi:hypothetical protein